jgi:N-acetylneuraminate synthase
MVRELNLDGHTVGEGHPVYMIAEVGINHNGDMQIAKRLIDAAFATGWHCVKFQKRNPELCVPESQRNVMRDTPWGRMTYMDYRQRVEFGAEEYGYIDDYCKRKPIAWTASAWDWDSMAFLIEDMDVPFLKIPSAKMTDHSLLRQAARSGKPVVMSTGMSTAAEIDDAVDVLSGIAGSNFALMHTNSAYPTPPEDVNLLAIRWLKERYGCVVGYSGHEYGLDPTTIAVALGARIIERHVTLDHGMWGTDQAASLEVHAMDMLHKRIRDAVVALGDGVKRVHETEVPIREKLRAA